MHHIGEIGDKISFRNVIVTDLQNLGIRVQKPRRKSGTHLGKVKDSDKLCVYIYVSVCVSMWLSFDVCVSMCVYVCVFLLQLLIIFLI